MSVQVSPLYQVVLAVGMAGAVLLVLMMTVSKDVHLRTWDDDIHRTLIRNGALAIMGLILVVWAILVGPLTM